MHKGRDLLNLRVGRIVQCEKHHDAEKLYVSSIDVSDKKVQVCSGLVDHIPIEQMQDRRVVVLMNLKASKMRGVRSEAMVLASEGDSVKLVSPPPTTPIGAKLQFDGFHTDTDPSTLKSKNWKDISQYLKTTEDGHVAYIRDGRASILRDSEGQEVSCENMNALVR